MQLSYFFFYKYPMSGILYHSYFIFQFKSCVYTQILLYFYAFYFYFQVQSQIPRNSWFGSILVQKETKMMKMQQDVQLRYKIIFWSSRGFYGPKVKSIVKQTNKPLPYTRSAVLRRARSNSRDTAERPCPIFEIQNPFVIYWHWLCGLETV